MSLHQFFVVTGYARGFSLYSVTDSTFKQVHPATATNIARRGEENLSNRQVFGGRMISVGKRLTAYNPQGSRPEDMEIENVAPQYWGTMSSRVIALFLDRADAGECFGEVTRPIPCDPSYLRNTLSVIDAIGFKHQFFHVAYGPEFALILKGK